MQITRQSNNQLENWIRRRIWRDSFCRTCAYVPKEITITKQRVMTVRLLGRKRQNESIAFQIAHSPSQGVERRISTHTCTVAEGKLYAYVNTNNIARIVICTWKRSLVILNYSVYSAHVPYVIRASQGNGQRIQREFPHSHDLRKMFLYYRIRI